MNQKFRGGYFFRMRKKTFSQISYSWSFSSSNLRVCIIYFDKTKMESLDQYQPSRK